MSVPMASTGPMFGPLAHRSDQVFVPRLVVLQTAADVVERPKRPFPITPRSLDETTEVSSNWSEPSQQEGNMMATEGDLPFTLSSSNRVLLNRNEAALKALKAQNNDIDRQFERVMAAHAAQQRLLQAELLALQQSTPSSTSGAATASAVDLSTVMSGQHHQGASNGKYFVSPFKRYKSRVRLDPSAAVTLPPPASSTTPQTLSGGSDINSTPSLSRSGVSSSAPTTVATTSGLQVQTTASPSLKLRQTPTGGLKLQPVNNGQVSSALHTMKTQGGKAVRVKVQLKVKLPPLKTGQSQVPSPHADPEAMALRTQEPGQLPKKQVIRLKATAGSKDSSSISKFSSLRKIDLVFAGERATSRMSTESDKGSDTKPNANNTLVLRCADGTLCRVPVGGTRKLQQLIANRDTILGEEGTSDFLKGRPYLKSCLKKPPRTRSIRLCAKKHVRFAPDTLDINRENKHSELQPTVRIGSQLYKLKLPSIKSVQRVAPSTSDRYTVRAVSLRPKSKKDIPKEELECIQESEEDTSTSTGADEDCSSPVSSPDSGKATPPSRINSGGQPSKYTDMVLSVAMKKKKAMPWHSKTPQPSPTEEVPTREVVSPSPSPSHYVVSKVQDRWKVTIKNT